MASGFNFKAPGADKYQATGPATATPAVYNFTGSSPAVPGSGPADAQSPGVASPSPGTSDGNKPATQSNFSNLYKSRNRAEQSQLKRASDMLNFQKEKRFDYLNHVRKITDLFAEEDLDEEEQNNLQYLEMRSQMGDHKAAEMLSNLEERKKKKEERKSEIWRFKNQLMHSEWLLEKPVDFEDKWVMVPAPQGKRNLIIATSGQTSAYSKTGLCISRFSSHLPGGGKHKHKWNMETSILDCIYNEVTKTYYIVDMMCWRQTPMYDTETQFRFYWMHEKFLEVPEVAKVSKQNPYRFEPLPNFRCAAENVSNVLSCNMSVPLDGLLYYHKEAHYVFGFTPLVLWIRPHMIPEALGIMVPQKFIDRAPPDYQGFEKHRQQCLKNMECRDENDKKRDNKRHQKNKQKLAEKLVKAGKDVSHLNVNFVKSGSLSMEEGGEAATATETKMDT